MNTTPGPMAPAYIPDIITDTRVMVIMAARHYTLDLAGAALAWASAGVTRIMAGDILTMAGAGLITAMVMVMAMAGVADVAVMDTITLHHIIITATITTHIMVRGPTVAQTQMEAEQMAEGE